jgi:lysozyme
MTLPSSARDIARAQLRIDEGTRAKPYRDSVGKLTIGVGRNLDDVGLRPHEVDFLLDNDIAEAEADARVLFAFDGLSANRQAALINMAFNLGRARLAAFGNLRAAIEAGDFARAAAEMLDSKWAKQVGPRASRLAQQMIEG